MRGKKFYVLFSDLKANERFFMLPSVRMAAEVIEPLAAWVPGWILFISDGYVRGYFRKCVENASKRCLNGSKMTELRDSTLAANTEETKQQRKDHISRFDSRGNFKKEVLASLNHRDTQNAITQRRACCMQLLPQLPARRFNLAKER